MKERLKTEIVKKRSRILTELCSNISCDNNKRDIGKKYNVLITEKGKGKTFVGRTENYKPVVINKKLDIGDFTRVNIKDAASTYLVGKLI